MMYVVDYEIDFKHHQWIADGDEDALFLVFLLIHSRQARTGMVEIRDMSGAYYTTRHGIPLRALADKDRGARKHEVKQWGQE